MNIGHIQGGTNAGWRRILNPKQWQCQCGKTHTTYSAACCSDRRPS